MWAYRTTHRTPTQLTPYQLIFGTEVVLPLEIQIPSLRVALREEITDEENTTLRLEELESLDEKRLRAQQSLELYRARISKAYNKLVRPRAFAVGDLVLVLRRPIVVTHRNQKKFMSAWEGPYVIEIVYDGGAYQLVNSEGERPMSPINGRHLKRYYA